MAVACEVPVGIMYARVQQVPHVARQVGVAGVTAATLLCAVLVVVCSLTRLTTRWPAE